MWLGEMEEMRRSGWVRGVCMGRGPGRKQLAAAVLLTLVGCASLTSSSAIASRVSFHMFPSMQNPHKTLYELTNRFKNPFFFLASLRS